MDLEGNMIRGGASEGGKNGVRQSGIPSNINEGPIKTLKSRRLPPVRPCVLTIQEGKLNKTQLVDGVVESFSFTSFEVAVVLFMGVADHIKVFTDKPRSVILVSNIFEFLKEWQSKLRDRGSVDISYGKIEVG